MKRALTFVVAVVLAFAALYSGPVEAKASVPDEIKTQHGYYDTEGSKVRYIITPKVASEVVGVMFDGKPARQARDGSWYRVMASQSFSGSHWIYTTIQTEAVEFDTWVRYRNLYPKE